ncbi:MAG: MopE-related protein [Myxococcota bacterium]
MASALWIALGLLGCDAPPPPDADRDGFRVNVDCDDRNPRAYPGAPEYCNDIDDNCDGQVDEEDALDGDLWFLDADGDGYGDASDVARLCEPGETGRVRDNRDCSDGDPLRAPEQPERCNDLDDDCDGQIDEDATVDLFMFFRDQDEDGYGAPRDDIAACDPPAGYVDNDRDCDDRSDRNFPGADEYCDFLDNDCDGEVDEDDAIDAIVWYVDADRDGYGDPATGELDCASPPNAVSRGEDCDEGDDTIYPGAAEVCGNGVINDCDNLDRDPAEACPLDGTVVVTDAMLDLRPTALTTLGASLGGGGDVNGDGVEDLLISGENSAGEIVSIVSGVRTGRVPLSSAFATISGAGGGGGLAAAGDIDGDGYDDIFVGSLVQASVSLIPGGDPIKSAVGRVQGANVDLGAVVAAIDDLDGDGGRDLLVSDPGADSAGVVWLMSGDLSGTVGLDDALLEGVGEDADAQAGTSVASAGDVDGDGTPDLVIGAPGQGAGGVAYLVSGVTTGALDLADADAILFGEDAGDDAGAAVSGGDTDNDGYSDLVVSAPAYDGHGAVYVTFGPASTTSSLSDAIRFSGDGSGAQAGAAVDVADVDGDDQADLLIGAPETRTTTDRTGVAYLVLGGVSVGRFLGRADVVFETTTAGAKLGSSVRLTADVDGDGRADPLIGAAGIDAAFLFYPSY